MLKKKKPTALEKLTESNFFKVVEGAGCLCLKLNPAWRIGIPDRLVVGPHQFVLFVELKRLGKTPTRIQTWWHNKLKVFGFAVVVPDNIDDAIEGFVIHLKQHMKRFQ